jgi:hypothetical protein
MILGCLGQLPGGEGGARNGVSRWDSAAFFRPDGRRRETSPNDMKCENED